ncbi:acyl-CoA dehydrogenase family protein [Mycolicibacterium flavescens]|uniref:Acyl-CoA oxidase/dehydrogenase middle domain-containing protein n=1 Tax=Mycolicibacterium flavescens TaxID=1776 RepID=A0A1E3RDH0_MYCFV|nr:acyl-CoA dehydrogenase family protein [Mycolicibacterium flavescens]MCV7282393.1 acyl-CoA dehydrogenase family protein [Mycolicibacterium flavescens]ODQ87916.1 hypothetical protein BHQ18_21670 [Mycolicibacterium flavescens]
MSTGTAAETGLTTRFAEALTADTLSALMRSTWTWDDRALRRDLSALLVKAAASNAATADDAVQKALRADALQEGSRFVSAVLGPHLVADGGSPLRAHFLAAASDPTPFDRLADEARAQIRPRVTEYLQACATADDADEPSPTGGPSDLGSAMRAFGRSDGASALRGNIALALQTLRTIRGDGAELAAKIERGQLRATLAAAEKSGSWDPALVKTRAVPETAGWKLTGAKHFVQDAADAGVLLVVARSVAGPSLFAVDADASGVQVTAVETIDPGRPLFTVELDDTPATLLGREGQGGLLMRRSIDLAMTALAGEQLGMLERAIGILAHHQHDWPGDELVQTVLDHAAALALWTAALAPDAGEEVATMAHIACSDASVRAARLAAGLTGDDEARSLWRRALSASLLLGGPAVYYERLLDRLGI